MDDPSQTRALDLDRGARSEPLLTGEETRIVRLCLSLLGVLSTGSLVGVAASFYLVNEMPLLLVTLSPIGRHLILVAPLVDPVTFVCVVVARRMCFYVPCFHLGRALGPSGILWVEARAARAARFVRFIERLFARASRAVLLLLPGPTVCTLAGIARMPQRVFLPIVLAGLVLRMLLVIGLGEWLRAPIESLLALIRAYRVPGTIALVAGVAAYQVWRRRAARLARRPI
jgi:hypothetical protein